MLLALAGAAWVVLVWQGQGAWMNTASMTMGLSAPPFLASWMFMMAAMMAPGAARSGNLWRDRGRHAGDHFDHGDALARSNRCRELRLRPDRLLLALEHLAAELGPRFAGGRVRIEGAGAGLVVREHAYLPIHGGARKIDLLIRASFRARFT
jgi:hypothetical protein